jgi:alpha-L-fucosidase
MRLLKQKLTFLCRLAITTLMVVTISALQARDLETLQKDFMNWKFGMFIHFNMSTFVPGGWSTGKENPKNFNPTELDMGQWADAAKAAHMKYAVLTVKHTGGWCLWPSESASRSVKMFTNYKNGKGDLVKEFCDAFRKRGIKVGFYYCFPLSCPKWANYETLPMEGYASGKADALSFIKKQFKELLTGYGKVDLVWIDQSSTHHGGVKSGDWVKVKNYIHSLQPDCIVIANNQSDYSRTDIAGYEYPYSLELPPAGNKMPSEVCDKLQKGWFSNPNGVPVPVRDTDYIVNKMLIPLNDNFSNYLLNCGPDKKGLMPVSVVAILKKIGESWNPDDPRFANLHDPAYGIQKKPIKTIPNREKMVAVTFDSAIGAEAMENAATLLKSANAKGTFFVTKELLSKNGDVIKKISKMGHSIGNGAARIEDLTEIEYPRLISFEIKPVQEMIKSITRMKPLAFRAPYGKYNEKIWNVLNYFGLAPVESSVMISASASAEDAAAEIEPGAIINFADKNAVEKNLKPLLDAIGSKGLKVETIRTMLEKSTSHHLRPLSGKGNADIVSGAE